MSPKLTHIPEGAPSEFEIESESVRAIRNLRGCPRALQTVLGAIVDGVGESVRAVDRTVDGTHGRLAHEAFRAWN